MKAILMSIRPQHVANILNGIKTLEIRKKFPIDYVGWVYIYCTKGKTTTINLETLLFGNPQNAIRNGKVVARFWCDKVEEIKLNLAARFFTKSMNEEELLKECCLTYDQLNDYLGDINNGYAIHITKLEIFDKPKEISEFKYYKKFSEIDYMLPIPRKETCERLVALTRAPQSWCYVEE